MSKEKLKKAVEIIESQVELLSDGYYDSIDESFLTSAFGGDEFDVDDVPNCPITQIDSDGHYNDGADLSLIFYVKLGEEIVCVKYSGNYSSWTDTHWDEESPILVEPYQEMVTKYRAVK